MEYNLFVQVQPRYYNYVDQINDQMGGGSIIYQTKSLLLTSCAVSQILGCP
jgi:hypothetical protein